MCHAPGLRPRCVRDAQGLRLKHCVRDDLATLLFRVAALALANKMARPCFHVEGVGVMSPSGSPLQLVQYSDALGVEGEARSETAMSFGHG
jgi:hypothetical protein